MKRRLWLLGVAAGLVGIVSTARTRLKAKREMLVFFGTQGSEVGEGIFEALLDQATGALSSPRLAFEAQRPTWLLRDASRPVLFAASELGNSGEREGEVLSFAIEDAEPRLRPISRVASGGGGATHLALTPDGTTLFVANFGGGQVAAMPVAPDGSLGSVRSVQTNRGSGPHRRQQGPHAHGVTLDPSGHFLLAPDMGADRVFIYKFDAARTSLEVVEPPSVETPAGSGPRHIVFGPTGRFAYLLTELSAEILVFSWDAARGVLTPIGGVSLDEPGQASARSAAALVMSRDGRYLYASNRSTEAIQVYSIDRVSGLLNEVQRIGAGGTRPWSAAFSPNGRWLIVTNQGSDSVTVFAVDRRTGKLSSTTANLPVPTPTSVVFARPIA